MTDSQHNINKTKRLLKMKVTEALKNRKKLKTYKN